jgi:GAF domain-containing protein
MPLTDEAGRVPGSLCAIDTTVRRWSDRELALLGALAHGCSAELRLRVSRYDAALERARRDATDISLKSAVTRSEMLLAVAQSLAQASNFDDLRVRVDQVSSSTP